jgi:hypothetical protein
LATIVTFKLVHRDLTLCVRADLQKEKSWWTRVNVKLLLPTGQSRGNSQLISRTKMLMRVNGAGVNMSGGGSTSNAWCDIWSAGQGIGAITKAGPAAEFIYWSVADYARA